MKLFAAALLFTLAGTAAAQQELLVHGGDGVVYRIDNYATQPSAVAVGTASLPNGDLPTDIAVDPVSGDFFFTVFPGERLRFQGWFRDSGPLGSHYTNAIMVIFS